MDDPQQNQYRDTVTEIQDVQDRLQKLYGKVRTLTAQKSESEQVKKVRQERDEAVSNVEKRLEFITSDFYGCSRGRRILMVDADGDTRIDDLARLEEVMDRDSGMAASHRSFRRWALDSEIVLLARFMSLRMVEVQYPQLPSMLSQPACKCYEISPTSEMKGLVHGYTPAWGPQVVH
ncbi:hypothetical protein Pmar_PMAR013658 [Perkinsus marinus ATCC 50983]|uniref:Uncharacterized protein n=1 Tax=Perkinsus marinus (strain ATCC 50983 / TXsc) TaxID=423536 RepID=C5LXY2_PERM5|nr:hypothetical protein Pmar_PMAR013658 [Perkinsus marinus ATCC 50983]EEQ98312.1 hypothetical protein Pmar_PMAR013658 [Perkinsus marinus ATCC 50983]|eukprot:XP_002765595.1 hypothetical protein Pmar_PMAR013658 [Perkinsus marinus ATCC 50983]